MTERGREREILMWGVRVGSWLARGVLRGYASSSSSVASAHGRRRPQVDPRWVKVERLPWVLKEEHEKVKVKRRLAQGTWRSMPKGTGGKWAVTGGDVEDGRRALALEASRVLVPKVKVPAKKLGSGLSKLARGNLLGGSDIMFGNKRSEKGKNRSRRAWEVNTGKKRVRSEWLGKTWKVHGANRVLREMELKGGLDNYLLRTTEERLQSDWGMHVREQLLDRMGVEPDRSKRLPHAIEVPASPYIKVERRYCKPSYVKPKYVFKGGLGVHEDKGGGGEDDAFKGGRKKKGGYSKEDRAAALAESLAAAKAREA